VGARRSFSALRHGRSREGGEPVLLDGDLLALPSNDEPLVTAIQPDGGGCSEQPAESTTSITNLQTFKSKVDPGFCCPDRILGTFAGRRPSSRSGISSSRSPVSRDEDTSSCTWPAGLQVRLGARTHNYTLLTLARRRLETLPRACQKQLRLVYQEDLTVHPEAAHGPAEHDVFGSDKQFAALGVFDAGGIIERRPRPGSYASATRRISIVTL